MSKSRDYRLRLYIAGGAQNSTLAIANLRAIGVQYLADGYALEVIDVLREPHRALDDAIMLTPTLLKLSPLPTCRIVGTLAETDTVLHALGLTVDQS